MTEFKIIMRLPTGEHREYVVIDQTVEDASLSAIIIAPAGSKIVGTRSGVVKGFKRKPAPDRCFFQYL